MRANSKRPDRSNRRSLRRDEGNGGRLLLHRRARLERGDPGRLAHPGRPARNGRSASLPRPRGRGHAAPGFQQIPLNMQPQEETTMRFMVMVKATQDSENGVMPDRKLLEDMGRFNEELVNAGVMQAVAR